MKALGVPSIRRVNTGANSPKASASDADEDPAAVVPAPVARGRDDRVHRTGEAGRDRADEGGETVPAPHATAIVSIGGEWPAERSTVIPWPFCTTSTVIASGTTSSTIARQEKTGA